MKLINIFTTAASAFTLGVCLQLQKNFDMSEAGTVIIETPEGIFELTPGTRTRPKEARSVNLTIEKGTMQTVFIE